MTTGWRFLFAPLSTPAPPRAAASAVRGVAPTRHSGSRARALVELPIALTDGFSASSASDFAEEQVLLISTQSTEKTVNSRLMAA
eukprot:COSAG01_NODE_81_length_27820_cov_22.659753_10_plen_85_part_00